MKIKTFILVGLAAGVSALTITSCAYDPYYSGGYGDGYGYGGSGFSTSYFVSTGSTRWAYDPYAGAYYDYSRRCYYDPYLNGYYPVGYRPRYAYGSPHPHGWSRGSGYCPPPSHVRSYNLTNYHDRSERYRSLGRSWSDNVRVDTHGGNHDYRNGSRDQRGSLGSWPGNGGSRGSYGDNRGSDRNHGNNPGAIFGGGGQRSSDFGRSNGDDRRSYTPQRSGKNKPDSRERKSEDKGSRRWDIIPSRGGSFSGAPAPTRTFSPPSGGDNGRGNFGTRPESPGSAPGFNRGENNPGRGGDREDSDRKGIRGLGQG